MDEILIQTKKERDIVDITKEVQKIIELKGVKDGLCHLFVSHTSAAITTADLDEGSNRAMLDAF